MTVENAARWRVTLSGLSARSMEETVRFGDAFTESAGEVAAGRFPDFNPYAGYYQSGSEMFVSVNVSASDAKSAERAGADILTSGLPSWITVVSVEARPLLAEPDFTSPPSRA
jgi:hypothetical protein